jgi:hypothetical protein
LVICRGHLRVALPAKAESGSELQVVAAFGA